MPHNCAFKATAMAVLCFKASPWRAVTPHVVKANRCNCLHYCRTIGGARRSTQAQPPPTARWVPRASCLLSREELNYDQAFHPEEALAATSVNSLIDFVCASDTSSCDAESTRVADAALWSRVQ